MVEMIDEVRQRAAAATPLRDLTDEEFRQRYSCDRFTATVLANRFRYIVSHMSTQLRTHAFSPIMRDTADLCAILSGPPAMRFPMASVSETLPLFNGSLPDAVRIVVEEYGVDELQPGDTLLVNDYYRCGTHFNDACNLRPVFYDGKMVGVVTLRAHLLDIGGAQMGYHVSSRRNTYQDGLRLPPMLIFSAGKPVASTFKLLHDNTRLGSLIAPDLKTIYHALELGDRLLVETIDRYGLEAYLGAIRYVNDVSAETTADALAALPDGVYDGEEWIDGDGLPDSPEYSVRVRITKVGDRAEIDLRGSSGATRSGLNCAWPDIKTAVALALKVLIDPKSPVTSGTLRNVDIVVPPDAIFNPSPPHACQGYYEPILMIVHAIFRALNPVLGEDAKASAHLYSSDDVRVYAPDGEEMHAYMPIHVFCGPWGANRHGDGDSGQQSFAQNLMMVGGIEAWEADRINTHLPAVAVRSEYVPDGGGAGANRGGAANVYDILHLFPAEHQMQEFHARYPLAGGGVNGGEAGPTGTHWLFLTGAPEHTTDEIFVPVALDSPRYADSLPQVGLFDPETKQFDRNGEFQQTLEYRHYGPGVISRQMTHGGGGWGDPLDRDPERVKVDVRDEYVTIAGAARDYGVVIIGDPARDPEHVEVDWDATRALRERLRSEARPG